MFKMVFGHQLERARQIHADNERLEVAVIHDYAELDAKSLKAHVQHKQTIRARVDQIVKNDHTLLQYYTDEHGTRKNELDTLYQTDETLFTVFYDQLNAVRQSHRSGMVVAQEKIVNTEIDVQKAGYHFSGEEFAGKYLDMHSIFQKYLNLKGFRRIKYLDYLGSFYKFSKIEKSLKTRLYHQYLKDLLEYLISFHERIYPLYPIEKIIARIEDHFQQRRTELLCEICNRSFAKESLLQNHLKSKKHLRNIGRRLKNGQFEDSIELLECKIAVFSELLKERIIATVQFIESMQTRTYEEIRDERLDDSADEIEEEVYGSDEEDGVIHNPLKIPLGWDGKPIPYWLYKLHGLNIEYTCEICGSYSYWGPRAFERHFKEWRHVNGMKALGIPNSEEFKNITQIDDAVALFQKLQTLERYKQWRPEYDEEFEDADGNVYNKKTYEDLRRQGLL